MAHAARAFALIFALFSWRAIAIAIPQEIVYEEIITITLGPGEPAPTSFPLPQKFDANIDDEAYHHKHSSSHTPVISNKDAVTHPDTNPNPNPNPNHIISSSTSTPTSTADPSTQNSSSSNTQSGSGGGGGGDTPPDSTMQSVLDKHNHYRSLHKAPPLTWSADIAASALKASNEEHCQMQHIDPGKYHVGENLWDAPDAGVVDGWYREMRSYDWNAPGFSDDTGHFTQVVWMGTGRLGCDNHCGIMRCQYVAEGNILGEFPDNVLKVGGIKVGGSS